MDIRYEGILYTVDTNDSTIALAKVKSFGTENREAAHPVAARDEVYDYIIFKASDIKDLIVCETPKVSNLAGGLPYDPAIISVSARSAPNEDKSGASTRSGTPHRQSPNFAMNGNRAPGAGRNLARGDGRPQQNRGSNQQYPRGGFSNQPRGRGGFAQNRNIPREKLKFDGDFDFEKANEQFQEQLCEMLGDKLKLESGDKSEEEEVKAEDKAFYDRKNSFFDRISCEALEKAEGKSGRPDWRKERETNQETFGHSAVRSFNYRRGFGQRGRGRGYGQGQGYGYRGGYNNANGGGFNNQGYRNGFNGGNNYRGRNNFNREGGFAPAPNQ